MKIFDCFPFFNELELLELRFAELYDVVDFFILSEANITHTGKEKPFFFDENKERYSKYLDKVIHIKVEDMPTPDKENVWIAERFQRNAISRGLDQVASIGDRVMVSDADEIPNPEAVLKYADSTDWNCFKQFMFYYYVNLKVNRNWGGTVMGNYGTFHSPQQLRRFAKRHTYGTVPHSGWHYSYLTGGDKDKIFEKTQSVVDGFSDFGFTREIIGERVSNLKDIYKRGNQYYGMKIVDITNNKPKSMDAFLEKYPHFFYNEPH